VLVQTDQALAGLEGSSMLQRRPATRTRVASGTGQGIQQR
jgi:hypothetical protein